MSTLPLPDIAPAPRRTSRCRALRDSGRTCGLLLVREPWVSLGYGEDCAERLGLAPPRQLRLAGDPAAADDLTLFDLINQGASVTVHTEQQMPVRNDQASIQSLVRADLDVREQVGIERYGTALQPNNGRDALRDAYEEAMDLTLYLRQAMEERRLAAEARTRPPRSGEPLLRVPDDSDVHCTVDQHAVGWSLDDGVKVSFGPLEPDAGDDDWIAYLSLALDALTPSSVTRPDDNDRYLLRGVSRDQVRQFALELLSMTDGGASGDWRALADRARGKPGHVVRALRAADA